MNGKAVQASTQPVFIALQVNYDTRPIIAAIEEDNPRATIVEYPAMVRIDAPGRLVVRRASIEERLGRDFDLRELQLNMISLGGGVEETEDEFIISWQDI